MAKQRPLYPQRRLLRALERGWTRVEALVNRFAVVAEKGRPYNPLYHLGTLGIFFLVVLTVTGIYLTLLYRPGADRAYETVSAISATWLGSLMRTTHRYASDGLIIVTLLHAIKMLVTERFWGSRWLGWLSGWVLVPLFWVIGIMGYWLVWDEGAQWLTEYAMGLLKGGLALSFLGPEIASRTFVLFIIVLFLHVFLPILLILGLAVHVLRLTRVRVWAPRWLMIQTTVAFVVTALILPVRDLAPADLGRLVTTAPLDWLYMGFLPLTTWLGGPLFWGLSLLLFGGAIALPWLAKGRDTGPAVILNPTCSGCALCARECPYEAIELIARDDGARYEQVAVIHPNLCTACGICVGTCSTSGVELKDFHSEVIREDLRRTMAWARAGGEPPTVLLTCERHSVLGTTPALALPGPGVPASGMSLLQAALPPRAQYGRTGDPGDPPILSYSVPCVGMLNPQWLRDAVGAGGGVVIAGCHFDDCSFREGPHWIRARLARRRSLKKETIGYIELAPGDRGAIERELSRVTSVARAGSAPPSTPDTAAPARRWGALVPGTVLMLVTALMSALFFQPAANPLPGEALLRVGVHHTGQLLAASDDLPPDILTRLPPNVPPEQVLGGERFPVSLRIEIDGETALDETYDPRGLRREGSVDGYASLWLAPGTRRVAVWMMDDGSTWQPLFDETVEIEAGTARTLRYDDVSARFVME